jgi:methyl-accepting chemotaxis protein
VYLGSIYSGSEHKKEGAHHMKLNFRQRIAALAITAIAGLVALTLAQAFASARDATQSRRDLLQASVESVYQIAAGYEAKAAAGTMTVE